MPNYDSFLGAVFVGLLIETILFGVACSQTFFYFRHSKRDRWLFKIIVTIISVLNTFQLMALVSMLYFWLVSKSGDIVATHKPIRAAVIEVSLSSFNDCIVRSFYARRVYILCGKKQRYLGAILAAVIITFAITIFALATRAMSVAHVIKMYEINTLPSSPQRTLDQLKLSWALYTFYGLGASADLVIAISMTILLARNRTGLRRMDNLVTFLMLFSLNTGLVTSVLALTCLILYATHPSTLYSLGVSYVLVQLHVNSLLVSLNARGALRNHTTVDPSTTCSMADDGHLSMSTGVGGDSFSVALKDTEVVTTKDIFPLSIG